MTPQIAGARWVQLSLNLHEGEHLAADIYHVCGFCGPLRARLRWREEGSRPAIVGELCSHLLLELHTLQPLDFHKFGE